MSLTPAGVQGEIKQQCERRSSAGGLLNGPRAQVRGVGVGVGRRTQALGPTKPGYVFLCPCLSSGALPSKLDLLWILYSLPTTLHAHSCVCAHAEYIR